MITCTVVEGKLKAAAQAPDPEPPVPVTVKKYQRVPAVATGVGTLAAPRFVAVAALATETVLVVTDTGVAPTVDELLVVL